MRLTVATIIDRLTGYRPSHIEEVMRWCMLPLTFVDYGQFRTVYAIDSTNLILKFPLYDKMYKQNVLHAREEYALYRRIVGSKRKFVSIQQYMPQIHCFRPKSGITLMQRYQKVPYKQYKKEFRAMKERIHRLMGVCSSDINLRNVGLDHVGCLKLIDMGYLQRVSK